MTARIKSPRRVYKLMVDPDRLELGDNINGWILKIVVDAGGTISRKDLLERFAKVFVRKRPDVDMRPSSVLSIHQRQLRDKRVLQIIDENGKPIPTLPRTRLVKGKA